MKNLTALAILSAGLLGVGCSNAEEPQSQTADSATAQTVSAEEGETASQFNLNLPGLESGGNAGASGYNLNLGTGGAQDGDLMIGSGSFGGGDFGSDSDLDLGISLDEPSTEDPLSYLPEGAPAAEAPEDDDIIRLPN